MGVICRNSLAIRCIFKSRHSELAKSIILVALSMAIPSSTVQYRSPLSFAFGTTIPHWRTRHFKFALNHGLPDLIARWFKRANQRKSKESRAQRSRFGMLIGLVTYYGMERGGISLFNDIKRALRPRIGIRSWRSFARFNHQVGEIANTRRT